MTDFFEKLKKGMDTEGPTDGPADEPIIEEPVVELTSAPIEDLQPEKKAPTKKKKPVKKKEEKIEIKEEVEKPEFKDELKNKEIEESLFEGLEGELTVDVFQSGKDLVIRSAIAGVETEDLDIVIENDLVIIKGERENRVAEEKDDYFFQECYWGRFKREIVLPVEVDSSRADAKMEKGILTIKIPIIERNAKTKIAIR